MKPSRAFHILMVVASAIPCSLAWISPSHAHSSMLDGITSGSFGDSSSSSSSLRLASRKRKLAKLLAVSSSITSETYEVVSLGNDDPTIRKAAEFFSQAYWLGTDHVRRKASSSSSNVPVVNALIQEQLIQRQFSDFTVKYGERMGKRFLESGLMAAIHRDTNEILGLVGIETCVLDTEQRDILAPDVSEELLTAAVGALGPKERRQYKSASAVELAQALLPLHQQQVVCVLCNLVVSADARGQGIALRICRAVEEAARNGGFPSLHLKVEHDNKPARRLYANKLGYQEKLVCGNPIAVRFDVDDGSFFTTEVETIILEKDLA